MKTIQATQSSLPAILKAAKSGDEIRFSGVLNVPLTAFSFAEPGVTIVAEPGASIEADPRSGWLLVSGCSGLRFRGFAVKTLLGFTGGSRLYVESMDFNVVKAGVTFRDATDVGVWNSQFRNGANGVGALKVRGIVVSGNSFTDNPADAVQLGVFGDVLIERNSFTNFRGEPLHRDAIQLIAADQTKPIFNVTIRANRYERGDGIPAQFIFLSDSAAGYDQFWVEGNVGLGSAFHGVTINAPINGTIENNFLQADTRLWNNQLLLPWIKPMNPVAGGVVTVRNNAFPPPAAQGDRTALNAWLSTPLPSAPTDISAALAARLKEVAALASAPVP